MQALHLAEAERVRITDRLNKSNQANEQLKGDVDGLKGQLYDTMEKAQQTELKKDEQIKDLENVLEDTKSVPYFDNASIYTAENKLKKFDLWLNWAQRVTVTTIHETFFS